MQKYRIYIDEVGIADLNSSSNIEHRFLELLGVIFDLDYVATYLNPTLSRLKLKHFNSDPDDPIIFHRKELVKKKPPFSVLQDEAKLESFNTDLLSIFKELNFTIIAVLIDKQAHGAKYSTWQHDPYHYCMEVIVERFFYFLKNRNAVGDLMFEARGGKEDLRLKESFKRIYEKGTRFVDPKSILTSKELKIKPKTANIAGLQIADLLAHPVRRYIFSKYLNMPEEKRTFGDAIIEAIEDKFYSYKGDVLRHGIKLLP